MEASSMNEKYPPQRVFSDVIGDVIQTSFSTSCRQRASDTSGAAAEKEA